MLRPPRLRFRGKRSRGRSARRTRRLSGEQLEGRRLLAITLDLGELEASDGVVLNSAVPQDRAGLSVSDAGDANGDGFDDLLVGAPVDAGFPAGTGQAYLVNGKEDGFGESINLFELTGGPDGSTVFGVAAESHVGFSVSGAGDLNNDGYHDYLIGAPAADRFAGTGNVLDAGHTYVVFGDPDGPPAVVSGLNGSNGFQLVGNAPFDRAGYSVGDAGDVNGDGLNDLLVGAPAAPVNFPFVEGTGQAYLVYGSTADQAASQLLPLLDGTNGIQLIGENLSDRAGFSVSGVGDINGDGFDDFAVGAPSFDRPVEGGPLFGSGATYVVFGGFDSMPALSSLDGTNGFRLEGLRAFDRSGFEVNTAGDVNGDGLSDLLVTAPADLNLPVSPGETYVLFGTTDGFSATINLGELNGSSGFVIQGIAGLDHAGFSANAAGDVNGDGWDDLIIGAPFASKQVGETSQVSSGEAYVVLGRDAFPGRLPLGVLADDEGLVFLGDEAFDLTGYSVSTAGDVNGDGFDDILIGAPSDFGNTFRPGRSYLIFGRDFTAASPTVGDAEDNTLTGTAAAETLIGGVGDDTLVGAGGADVLLGGQGDDWLSIGDGSFRKLDGGRGEDHVVLAGAGIHVDLTAISDLWISEIEGFDLTGSGDNELTLTVGEVLRISETSNRLVVRRDAGDRVNIGVGWTETGSESIDGDSFRVFEAGVATLLVENVPPQLDLNGPDDAGTDFAAVFTEDDPAVSLSDSDLTIIEDDGIVSARITLSNPLDGAQELLAVTPTAGITAIYDSSTATLNLSGAATAADYETTLRSVTYENLSQSPTESDRFVELQISDGLADSPLATTTISVIAVNDAPILDLSATTTLSPIEEDTTDTEGDTIGSLIVDGSLTDPDGSAVEAIAVVAVDDTNGEWQYSLDAGIWTSFASPSDSSARLLGTADRIRFLPVADFNGPVTIQFRGWDLSQGIAGNTADTSSPGGSSPFSSEVGTATLEVTPVNDAPVLDTSAEPALMTIRQDNLNSPGSTVGEIVVDGSISDVDGTPAESIAVTATDDTNGVWEFSADGSSWTQISASESAALLLPASYRIRFVPRIDFVGSATLSFRAWDESEGSAGSTADTRFNGGTNPFSTEVDTVSIDVRVADGLPTLDPIPLPVILAPGTTTQVVMLSGISSGGDAGETVTVTATSSALAVLPSPAVDYVSPASSGEVTLVPNAGAAGWSIVSVTVREPDGDEVTESFAVSVGDNPLVWQNPFNQFDVNGDGSVAPSDVLAIINELNGPAFRDSTGRLPAAGGGSPPPFFDVSGDFFAAPNDALQLINFLNGGGSPEGEFDPRIVVPTFQSIAEAGTIAAHDEQPAASVNSTTLPESPARPLQQATPNRIDRAIREISELPQFEAALEELDMHDLARKI